MAMMKGTKVLVATDLSENSAPAARWAVDFADRMGLPIAVVHILDITVKSFKGEYSILGDEALRERANTRLSLWFEERTGRRPDEVILDVGSPSDRIEEACRVHDPAALVISMSGKGAWNRLVFGSTALKLAHSPPAPLVIVHPEHGVLGEEVRLAVGTDFSNHADAAVVFAGEFARRLAMGSRVRVDLVHSHVLPSTTVILDTELPEELQSTAVVNWAERAMERFVAAHEADLEGVAHECHLVTDHPVHGLLEFVDAHGVDILVMGHFGRQAGRMHRLASVMIKTVQQMRSTMIIVPT
ncbi:MAG: universal stress protein [Bradymonadaceae bacterium]